MKAERRHELRENDLQHALESTRDYLNENGARLGVAAVVVLVIVGAVSFGVRSRSAAYEDFWRQKNQLSFEDVTVGRQSLAKLDDLTRQTSDKAFVLSSLIDQGRQALRMAEQVPFPPDPEFNAHARTTFNDLKSRFPDNPMAQGIAELGLATASENEFVLDKNPAHKEKAKAHLESVVKNPLLNGLPFQQMAVNRLATLDATFSPVIYVPPAPPVEEPSALEVEPAVDFEPMDVEADFPDQ